MSEQEHYEREFEELKSIAKSTGPDDHVRLEPPADLWSRIEAGIASPAGAEGDLDPALEVAPTLELRPVVEHSDVEHSDDPRWSPAVILAAAASLIVVLISASLAIGNIGGEPVTTFAAEITNADLPEPFDGTATATLEVDEDPMLVLDFDTELPAGETIQVWILSVDESEIIHVGTLEPGNTTWDWPAGFPPTMYPHVDVSIEPDDGDPAHSGRSILRGELTTTS